MNRPLTNRDPLHSQLLAKEDASVASIHRDWMDAQRAYDLATEDAAITAAIDRRADVLARAGDASARTLIEIGQLAEVLVGALASDPVRGLPDEMPETTLARALQCSAERLAQPEARCAHGQDEREPNLQDDLLRVTTDISEAAIMAGAIGDAHHGESASMASNAVYIIAGDAADKAERAWRALERIRETISDFMHGELLKEACGQAEHVFFVMDAIRDAHTMTNPSMGGNAVRFIANEAEQKGESATTELERLRYGVLKDARYRAAEAPLSRPLAAKPSEAAPIKSPPSARAASAAAGFCRKAVNLANLVNQRAWFSTNKDAYRSFYIDMKDAQRLLRRAEDALDEVLPKGAPTEPLLLKIEPAVLDVSACASIIDRCEDGAEGATLERDDWLALAMECATTARRLERQLEEIAQVSAPLDAPAGGNPRTSLAAVRERIALVVKAFTQATVAFPVPMTSEEAEAALAMTDRDIDDLSRVLAFAERWGVTLDWLLAGDMAALIRAARRA